MRKRDTSLLDKHLYHLFSYEEDLYYNFEKFSKDRYLMLRRRFIDTILHNLTPASDAILVENKFLKNKNRRFYNFEDFKYQPELLQQIDSIKTKDTTFEEFFYAESYYFNHRPKSGNYFIQRNNPSDPYIMVGIMANFYRNGRLSSIKKMSINDVPIYTLLYDKKGNLTTTKYYKGSPIIKTKKGYKLISRGYDFVSYNNAKETERGKKRFVKGKLREIDD